MNFVPSLNKILRGFDKVVRQLDARIEANNQSIQDTNKKIDVYNAHIREMNAEIVLTGEESRRAVKIRDNILRLIDGGDPSTDS